MRQIFPTLCVLVILCGCSETKPVAQNSGETPAATPESKAPQTWEPKTTEPEVTKLPDVDPATNPYANPAPDASPEDAMPQQPPLTQPPATQPPVTPTPMPTQPKETAPAEPEEPAKAEPAQDEWPETSVAIAAEPTRVTLQLKEQPLGEALEPLSKALGFPVALGKYDFEAKNKPIALDVKDATIWEVFDEISKQAQVRVQEMGSGFVLQSSENMYEPIADIQTVGAFRIVPLHSYGALKFVIEPEPKLGAAQLKKYKLSYLYDKNVKTFDGSDAPEDAYSQGRFEIESENGDSLFGRVHLGKEAKKVELKALFDLVTESEEATTPKLADLASKPLKLENGELRVVRLQQVGDQTELEFDITGKASEAFDVNVEHDIGPNEDLYKMLVELPDGTRTDSSEGGWSIAQNGVQLSIGAYPHDLEGAKLGDCKVMIQGFKQPEFVFGPLKDLAPPTFAAGLVSLQLYKTEKSYNGYQVELIVSGAPVDPSKFLLVKGDKSIAPKEAKLNEYRPNTYQIVYDAEQVGESIDDYQLRFFAPTKVGQHVLTAEFENLPLPQ